MAVPNDSVTSGHTLPSDISVEYKTAIMSSPEKGEEILQNGLLALADQKDLIESWQRGEKEEIPNWLWQTLTISDDDDDDDGAGKQPNLEAPEYEWWTGTRLIHSLLPQISPFEIHSIASQSIASSEGSRAHWSLCLLLCIYSLRQCPAPIEQRWKRWQSLVCETIRLFQNYGLELGGLAVPLWIQHVIPACQHVIQQLPPDAYHIAFLSSLVGTTSTLVAKTCEQPGTEEEAATSVLSHVLQLLEAVRTIIDQGDDGHSETWVFLNPWRTPWRTHSAQLSMEEQREELDFLQQQNDITWWNQSAHRHERVAGMDTAWNDLGISLLALIAFDNRPMVFTPAYTWRVWFPHVSILFNKTGNFPFLEHLPLTLLHNLFVVIPEKSLPAVSSTSSKPDSPFETFQLLSNLLVLRKPDDESAATMDQELESKARSERVVIIMKSLLARYQPVNQVKIIRKLVHDCPHPGLQAKFMDLLRPVIFDDEAHDAFWAYISSFVKDLPAHMDEKTKTLLEVDDLVQKVEIYVGAITMIQLWCMVKGRLPKRIKGTPLGRFYKVLKSTVELWMTDNLSMPPDDYYRLYLLEGALRQVVHILDVARQKRNSAHEEGSLDSNEIPETKQEPEKPKEPETPAVVFGDFDIFS